MGIQRQNFSNDFPYSELDAVFDYIWIIKYKLKKMGNPQTIWYNHQKQLVETIDQRKLPFQNLIIEIGTLEAAGNAISEMVVRGAPLIGVTAAYGMYLAARNYSGNDFQAEMKLAAEKLKSTRPTAVNLAFAVDEALSVISDQFSVSENIKKLFDYAESLKQREIDFSKNIGLHGLKIIQEISKFKNGEHVQILTHCNAGRLACVELGTATAPIYLAFEAGIMVHVWVDETRPRNQGARLTAWELGEAGIPYTIIPDNTGGHLMQHKMVDMVIVGSDRTTLNGDVANKIGTYLKALAAADNGIPFYVALPSTTIDWNLNDGLIEIPIEQRDGSEVSMMEGLLDGKVHEFSVFPEKSAVANYGFDVTPARLVTGLITERGVCKATREGILNQFPEKANQ
jgi:methylthioribose-1-phosphate isomerase